MNENILVSIQCLVYNHEPYLRKCLDGIVMQKTNFKFQAIVHDDASTDNSAQIIAEYAEKYSDIILPIYETENQYSKKDGSLGRIVRSYLKGKYVAFCEGDDYWTDPYKLQKQVDYLEAYPECGLVYTAYYRLYQTDHNLVSMSSQQGCFRDLVLNNFITTCTVCLRKDIFERFYNDVFPKMPTLPFGDYQLWLYIASQMDIKYMDDRTGVYRILDESASHFGNATCRMFEFIKGELTCRELFINLYDRDKGVLLNKVRKKCRRRLFRISLLSEDNRYFKETYILEKNNRLLSLPRYIYLSLIRYTLPLSHIIIRKFKKNN